jgi:GT2 family glycosyltransferase
LKIAAVIVTYNGLDYLKQCMEGVRNQIYRVDQIIVVNNCEKDETADWLSSQDHIVSINQKNTGGAGGFKMGIKKAYEMKFDWVWCLDHDIILPDECLFNLISSKVIKMGKTGFISSVILDSNDNPVPINVPQFENSRNVIKGIHKLDAIPIICSSFSSVLINLEVVDKVGLPYKDFFIWGDDSEFTLRIYKYGYQGYLITNSIGIHMNCINSSEPFNDLDITDIKFKYGIRNYFYINNLKSKIIYKSNIRGWISSFYFYFKIVEGRVLRNGFTGIKELPYIIQLIIWGIFFKPKE